MFTMLFVCADNICRSALAEVLMRQLLFDRLGPVSLEQFDISSAGFRALSGAGMHPDTRVALTALGEPVYQQAGTFVARQLEAGMVQAADVVLTAEEADRPYVAWAAPDAVKRIFTLRRFARAAAAANPQALPAGPVERAHTLVPAAAALAPVTRPARAAEDSVPDPMGGPPALHLAAADVVFHAVATIVDVVAPLPVISGESGRPSA